MPTGKGIIVGDSLLRPVKELLSNTNYKTLFLSGATVSSLTDHFFSATRFSPELWNDSQFIWLLVGTNDIDNGLYKDDFFDVNKFIQLYSHLLFTIRAHLRDVHIVVCGLVPRLVDYKRSKDLMNIVNKRLEKLCRDFGVRFSSVDKGFCFSGIPQEAYYKPDRLHLSVRGAKLLVKSVQREAAAVP